MTCWRSCSYYIAESVFTRLSRNADCHLCTRLLRKRQRSSDIILFEVTQQDGQHIRIQSPGLPDINVLVTSPYPSFVIAKLFYPTLRNGFRKTSSFSLISPSSFPSPVSFFFVFLLLLAFFPLSYLLVSSWSVPLRTQQRLKRLMSYDVRQFKQTSITSR